MLKFNFLEENELLSVIKAFISALLPHENYDSSHFSDVMGILFKYVKIDEFQMAYKLLIDALYGMNRLKVNFAEYEPRLDYDTFERLLEASIMDAVTRPELGVKDWLAYEGMTTNLQIQTVKEEVCQRICELALDLYKECFDLGIACADAIAREQELKAAFIAHVGVQCINTQSEIMRHEAKVGRKKYQGFEDWLEYTTQMTSEIRERIRGSEENKTLVLNSIDSSKVLLSELQNFLIPIANYGIPEIDAYTPILRHRLVVVVGKENIGKTKFAVDKAVNVLLAGGRVVYMCGESQKSTVYAAMLINYIYKRYGIKIRNQHLSCPESCPEDIQKIIGMCVDEVVRSESLVLADAFDYSVYYDQLCNLYDSVKFDMVVVDHSCALEGVVGDGSLKAKIDRLAEDSRRFKKKFPCCVMIMSHPSQASKETAKQEKRTEDSPTKGSQNLSTEADEVFYLRENDALRKQGFLMLENTKRRDAGVLIEPIILRKHFDVSALEYDETIQNGGVSTTSVTREDAINLLKNDCEDEGVYNL